MHPETDRTEAGNFITPLQVNSLRKRFAPPITEPMARPSFFSTRYNSFKFAIKGMTAVFRSEPNMHLHVLAGIVVFVMAYRFEVTRLEWCMLAFCVGMVWIAEIFNTAIETLTDLVSPEHHVLAGKTKDQAAGAVLMAAITSVVIGLLIFVPYWQAYINS